MEEGSTVIQSPAVKPVESTGGGRYSGIELLRIICMLLIILHHAVVHSGLYEAAMASPASPFSIAVLAAGAFGKTGINCFVLITGYFMCKSRITLRKFLKLFFEVLVWRAAAYLAFFICGGRYDAYVTVHNLLPICDLSAGFIDCFLVFYLLIPFLNVLVRGLSMTMHAALIFVLVLFYCLFASFTAVVVFNYISWFVVLYAIASFVRKYDFPIYGRRLVWGIAAALSLVLSCLSVAWLAKTPQGPYFLLSDVNKLLALTTGFSAFMFFRALRFRSRIVNAVARTVFGVYMFHDGGTIMRFWLWRDFLDPVRFFGMPLLWPYLAACAIGIFAAGAALDFIRISLIERPGLYLYDRFVSPRVRALKERFLARARAFVSRHRGA